MSVIIRLQNLPWSANALDIRGFFRGLSIPDGGVHIVGGEMGDAFIAFSTDEDARQAMMQDRGKISEVQIRLLLSSRAEMQKVIETARQQSLALQLQMSTTTTTLPQNTPPALPTPQPPVITTNSLHNILSSQPLQTNATGVPFDSSRAYTSVSQQQQKTSFPAAVDINRTSRETSRDRRRSNSRERRRSRSSDRSGSNRRRRDRSRSREHKFRKSSRRSRSHDRSRDRSRERSRERSRDRTNRDRDRNGNRGLHKNTKDIDSAYYSQDWAVEKRNASEKSVEKEESLKSNPNPAVSVWEVLPTNAYTTSTFAATYAMQAYQNVLPAGISNPLLNSSLPNLTQKTVKASLNSPSERDVSTSKMSSSASKSDVSSLSFFNANQLENRPTFAFQNPYTQTKPQAKPQTTLSAESSQPSLIVTTKDQKVDEGIKTSLNAYNTTNLPQLNQFNTVSSTKSTELENVGWPYSGRSTSSFSNQTDAFGRNIPKAENSTNRFEFSQRNESSNRKESDEDKSCVKITNMCPSTSYSDIRKFFSGLYIPNNGIKMINDQHGLRVGTAYVRFVRALNVPKALVRDGTQFKSKKISLEPVGDEEFDSVVDSFKPTRGHRFTANDNSKPNYDLPRHLDIKKDDDIFRDGKPIEKVEEKPFSILFVKDIPPYSTQQDVMKMFSSYTILDILLTNRADNRREIIAYVKFHRVEDAQAAYAEHSSHRINQRPVRVTTATDEDYERAKENLRIATEKQLKEQQELEELEKQKQAEAEAEAVAAAAEAAAAAAAEAARLQEELERDDQQEDEHEHDEEEMNCEASEYQHLNDDQNNKFKSEEKTIDDLEKERRDFVKTLEQLQSKHTNPFSGIPSLLDIPQQTAKPEKNTDPRLRRNRPSRFDNPEKDAQVQQVSNNFVIVKNCEYKTSIQAVGEYFISHNLMPNHVELLRNHRNQPCGEFIIELRSNEDAGRATGLNSKRFNSRVIRVNLITPQQIADRLGKPFMNCFPSVNNLQHSSNNPFNSHSSKQHFDNNSKFNFSSRSGIPNDQIDFTTSDYTSKGVRKKTSSFKGNNNKRGRRGGGPPGNRSRSRFNPFSDSNDDAELDSSPNKLEEDCVDDVDDGDEIGEGGMPEKFQRPGCVVEMENVPYRADLGDIIDFFDGYNVRAEDIIRRYNDDGTPTGDARVAFSSATEAKAAFEDRRQKSIFNRTIFLNVL